MKKTFFIKSSLLNSLHLFHSSFEKLNSLSSFFVLLDETPLPCFSFLYKNNYKNTFISFEESKVHFFNYLSSDSIDISFDDVEVLNLFHSTLKNKYHDEIHILNSSSVSLSFSINNSSDFKEILFFSDNFLFDTNFSLCIKDNVISISHSFNNQSFLYRIHNFFDFERVFYFSSFENSLYFRSSSFSYPSYFQNTLYTLKNYDVQNFFTFLFKRTDFF